MLERMLKDIVTLVKEDGRRFEDIRANVQKKKIFITDASIPVEEGDRILRELPNGLVESYLVLDRGFYDTQGSFGAHYQIDVEKESSPRRTPPAQTIIYNLHGTHSRVNIQSHDASTNVVSVSSDALFTELRETLKVQIQDSSVRDSLIAIADDLEHSQGTGEFTTKYKEFMAAAADHVTVLAPFLPALAQLIAS